MKKAFSAIKVIALVIIFIFFAVWASSRWLITYAANSQFEKDNSGMELTIDSMSLNLFGPSVKIDDLTLTMPNDNHVSFKHLELELEYLPLFFKEVVVKKFVVNDINVRFHQIANSTTEEVQSDKQATDQKATNKQNSEQTPPIEPQVIPAWLLIVQNLHINNLQLDASVAGNQIKTSNTHFHLNNTQIDLEQSLFETEIDIAISFVAQVANQAQTNEMAQTSTKEKPTPEPNTSDQKTPESIKPLITAELDQFTFKTKVKAQDIINAPKVQVVDFAIAMQAVKAQLPEINAVINQININFDELNASNLLAESELDLASNLNLSINNINAVHIPTESIISDINNITLNQVGLQVLLAENQPDITVSFENFNIQDILLLQYDSKLAQELAKSAPVSEQAEERSETNVKSEHPQSTQTENHQVTLFTLNGFNLNQLKTRMSEDGTNLQLDSVKFDKADANLLLHALPMFLAGEPAPKTEETNETEQIKDSTAVSEETAEVTEETSSEKTESTTEEQPAFTYTVREISHAQPITIQLTDKSVIPEFEQKIIIEKLSLNQVESNFFNMQANIEASINEYSKLLLDVNPNTVVKKKDVMLVDMKLTNFDLVSVSPYVKKAADMAIERGNVDVNSIVNIDKEGWKGDIHLVLKSLGMTTVNTSHDVSMEDESVDFIPLNALLDKIADSKGHLEIDLPIEGKNGELSGVTTGIIRNVVEIITTEAAKSYLVQTFVPYSNIVSIAQYAGNKLFEINIEDLVFPAGKHELPAAETKVFDAYAKLIKEQDTLVITVCPVSTWADLGIKSAPENSDVEIKLTEPQLSQLYELAKKREVYFKEQLIAQKADMSRLVSCATKISKSTEKSGYLGFTTKG